MTGPLRLRSDSPRATRAVAEALGRAIDPVPRGGMVVVLTGDLGAGKTVFASGLARGLGVPAAIPVTSPTFTVAKAYRGRVPLHHVDAYHLHSLAEFEAAGLEEMGGDGRVTCVEWGDRVPAAWPADRLEVDLTPIDTPVPDAAPAAGEAPEPPRRIELRATGPQAERVLARALPALRSLDGAS